MFLDIGLGLLVAFFSLQHLNFVFFETLTSVMSSNYKETKSFTAVNLCLCLKCNMKSGGPALSFKDYNSTSIGLTHCMFFPNQGLLDKIATD